MQFDLGKAQPALLVLDLQELFSSAEGPFENTSAGAVIEQVNRFAGACHDCGLPVICSRYLLRDDLSDAGLLIDNPVVQAGQFCASSPWMQLDRRLQPPPATIHLQRNRPGAFWNGALAATLENLRVDTLLLCGLSVNNAISTTARDAFARDIATLVVKDCTGAAPWEKDLESYFEILDTWTAEVASSAAILQRLK